MVIKQTIRCDKCNKIIKENPVSVNINDSNYYLWELQFCSIECCENHKFKLIKEEEDYFEV